MSHWTRELTGARPHGPELDWLGPEEDRVRSQLGDGAVDWAIEVGDRITAKVTQEIPVLRGITEALRRATTSTTLQSLTLVAGLAESEVSLSSTEEIEISRQFARRGLALDDLLRSFRVGYAVLGAALLDAATQLAPKTQISTELRRISVLLLEVMDDFISGGAAAFLDEQDTWTASITAARFDLVTKILDGQPVDDGRAEQVLDYPLGAAHVAIIAWSESPRGLTGHDLRSVVGPVLRHWGAPAATLVIPVGSDTVWAWGAVRPAAHASRTGLPEFDDVHIVAGQLGHGLEGFRRSHLEAQAVERLVRLNPEPPHTTTIHEDVELEVLLLADPEAARQFVARQLGALAADDPRMVELRSTLGQYLDMDRSISKVAAAEHIARNTVTYRVQQAFSICAHPVGAPTAKLRAALMVRDWLATSPQQPH
ncbi:PucR family transcriptional regulator [Rhodococcus koreensis]